MAEPETLSSEEIATYLDAVAWLMDLLGSSEVVGAWSQPSALSRYSTGGVAAHVVQGGVLRLEQLLAEPPTGKRLVSVWEFFGPAYMPDPEADDPLFVTLRAGAEQLAAEGPASLLDRCTRSLASLAASLPSNAADHPMSVIRIPDGQVPLRDYLRTRVLEVVVHGDDLVASVPGWSRPEPPPAAVEVCLGACVDLARSRSGGLAALRAFTRAERADPGRSASFRPGPCAGSCAVRASGTAR